MHHHKLLNVFCLSVESHVQHSPGILSTLTLKHCRYDLHVLLVEHGKRCVRCSKNGRPRKEQHGPCPLTNLAAAAKAGHKLSAKEAVQDAEDCLENASGTDAGKSA